MRLIAQPSSSFAFLVHSSRSSYLVRKKSGSDFENRMTTDILDIIVNVLNSSEGIASKLWNYQADASTVLWVPKHGCSSNAGSCLGSCKALIYFCCKLTSTTIPLISLLKRFAIKFSQLCCGRNKTDLVKARCLPGNLFVWRLRLGRGANIQINDRLKICRFFQQISYMVNTFRVRPT